jgi:hypothetical protein
LTEPAEGRLSRPYDEITGTGGIAELSAKVKKQYGIQAELTGSKVGVHSSALISSLPLCCCQGPVSAYS